MNPQSNWSILDRELGDRTKDAFGHDHYAALLVDLIEAEHHSPPFSIGLLGSWGTGKSTIKEMYLSALQDDQEGGRGNKRKDRIHTITFNAWRYGGDEDIKRALLRHAYIEMGGNDFAIHRELYQQISEKTLKSRSWIQWLKEAITQNASSVVMFVILQTVSLLVVGGVIEYLGLTNEYGITAILIGSLSLTAFLVKNIVDLRLKSPALFSPSTTISFPASGAEEYERLLIQQINEFKQSSKGRLCKRLVVFVDDLDRLSANEMVVGLDAIRTFLEIPASKLPNDFGVIFVISCDEDRVAEALSRGRGGFKNTDLPGSVFTRWDARRYLDRLFQFRLEIPPFPKQDMRKFAEEKLRGAGSFAKELEDNGVPLRGVVDRLIHVGVQSPRNAIQILNAFLQTWRIAIQREKSGVGSSTPGALHDGAVTNHPISLAALCVLRVDFPDFFNELQIRPDLIRDFNKVIFGTHDFRSLSVGSQESLKEFLIIKDKADEKTAVRPEYRQLRQYLSSLQGLRWPDRIQPLLLLADDPITRRHGDRAAEINDAFVSGDTKGVLEVLGYHLNNEKFEDDDIKMLSDLAETVSEDTEARRINAARVLAAVIDRIPDLAQRGLMMPLARQMIDLKDVRMNVGPESAIKIISQLDALDREEVVGSFSQDLLTGQDLQWRLPNGGIPNLDELLEDVRSAVELALIVNETDGLQTATYNRIRKWLLSREIHFNGANHKLPFIELDTWISNHPEPLLLELGAEYTAQAISEFEAAPTSLISIEGILSKVEQVHKELMSSGEEGRDEAWRQLTKMVSLIPAEVNKTAWTSAAMHADCATGEQARGFLSALAERLHKEMVSEDENPNWALDREDGAEKFVNLLTQWEHQITSDQGSVFIPLLSEWSEEKNCAGYMVLASKILEGRDKNSWKKLVEHISTNEIKALPWKSWELLASKWEELDEDEKANIASQMERFITDETHELADLEKYTKLVDALSLGDWAETPLKEHRASVYRRILEKFNDKEYISGIFIVGAKLLKHEPQNTAGNFLSQIMQQAFASPKTYPIIHQNMIGLWPQSSDKTGSYDPTQIAEQGIQFIVEHSTVANIGSVFESIVDLHENGQTSENIENKISESAAILWSQDPLVILKCINKIADYLSPESIQKILTGPQKEGQDSDILSTVTDNIVSNIDDDRKITIAKNVLSAPPKQIDVEPDGAFNNWMKALKSNELTALKELLGADDLNDEQNERIVWYALNRKKELGVSFFIDVLEVILTKENQPKALEAIISNIDDVINLAKTADQKASLYPPLIRSLTSLPSTPLAKITRAIRQLGGEASLEESSTVIDQLDDDQLAIVIQEMPNSKVLQKALKRMPTKIDE